jgi:hypothetical protein
MQVPLGPVEEHNERSTLPKIDRFGVCAHLTSA